MGWGQGIGIGWPNATSSGITPGPTTESYGIYSCSGEENLGSNPYPIGSFIPGYRITIGGGNYGYVTSAIPAEDGEDIGNLPIGNVDNRCDDSTIQLSLALIPNETQYMIRVNGYVYSGGLNVTSENNTLSLIIHYYAPILDPDGGSAGAVNGNVVAEITSYNMLVEELQALLDVYAFTLPVGYYPEYAELTVTNFSLGNTLLGPYDTGQGYPNKFVTTYGNVWSFLWPIEP